MAESGFSHKETRERDSRNSSPLELMSAGQALAEFAAAFLTSPQRAKSKQTSGESNQEPPTAEHRYRVLVEQIPAVVFMAYLDGGLGEAYVSPQIEQMLGFSQEQWLDDPIRWYEQIHPDDRARWSVEAAETFITGKPLKSVYRVLAADGRIVWFHCEAKLVRRDSGEPWFIHGVGFDITELKETEIALQRETAERERLQKLALQHQIARTEQSESRLAAIVQSSEDAIIGKTLDGIITNWNAAATRLYGYEPEEMIGKSMRLLFPPELQEQESHTLRTIASGHAIPHQETQHITKAGARIEVSRSISPIRNSSGAVIGVSTIARDITQQKQVEEKLRTTEKLAATGRLAATIAHEINNPLEAVTNLLYLAQTDASASPVLRRYLQIADEELGRVAHLAKQTLGFYRDTSSQTSFSAAATIEDVLTLYSRRAAGKNVLIDRQLDPSIQAFGFVGEFRQVLSNLVGNALDAMGPEGGRLLIRARRSCDWKEKSARLRVSVGDNGVGIPPEMRDKVFNAFFTTKSHYGTGLGLWLSRSIVQKHGGSIRLCSSLAADRSGTVVSFLWPLAPSAESERAA